MTNKHKQDAIEHLEKAKEKLALEGEAEKSAVASSLKRSLEVEQEINR